MAKKMSKASVKISHNHHHRPRPHRHRHHTLKPRVYITQSSSFKTLVQELTGYDHNTANPSTLPVIPPPSPKARNDGLWTNHNDQHTGINDHNCNSNDNISSFDALDSSWLVPFDYTDRLSNELLGSQQQPPSSFVPKTGNQIGLMESWLLEIGTSAYMP